VRRAPASSVLCSWTTPQIACGDYCVSTTVTTEGKVQLSILMKRKGVSYMLTRFPVIREFNSMLKCLAAGSS